VTMNLVPSLLDQRALYVRKEAQEPLQKLGLKRASDLSEDERVFALKNLFMANVDNLIRRFPRFAALLDQRGPDDEESLRAAVARFSNQDFLDLQVVSKLAWFDLEWQAKDPVLRELILKGQGFSEEDKLKLAEREAALLSSVIPAYRKAAERGQVELSTSPYYHPILPLLCDTEIHHEAQPAAPLPRQFRHPEDAADQIRRAIARHEEVFGVPPQGMWPSEGSVSEEAVLEMVKAGIRWTATDEGILERSIGQPLHRDSRGTVYPLEKLYQPWVRRTASGDIAMVFRDRALSDLIGFSYSGLDPERAASDLLERLRRVGEGWKIQGLPGDPLVCIILDGENAWEYFRDGGRVFLKSLYRNIESASDLKGVTMSEALSPAPTAEIPRVFAGSWIHADFSVWIGHPDDRRAWDLLGDSRDALARCEGSASKESLEHARESFRSACGSDWCWWYGEDHSSENDIEFDRLFRHNLRAVYKALELEVPEALGETLISTRRMEVRQSQPTGAVLPILDGKLTPEEWVAAGVHRVSLAGGAMHAGHRTVRTIRFGVGEERLYILVESAGSARELLSMWELAVSFPGPSIFRYRVQALPQGISIRREERTGMGWVAAATHGVVAADEVFEIGIPLVELRPEPGRMLRFRILMLQAGIELERHPEAGPIALSLEAVTRG